VVKASDLKSDSRVRIAHTPRHIPPEKLSNGRQERAKTSASSFDRRGPRQQVLGCRKPPSKREVSGSRSSNNDTHHEDRNPQRQRHLHPKETKFPLVQERQRGETKLIERLVTPDGTTFIKEKEKDTYIKHHFTELFTLQPLVDPERLRFIENIPKRLSDDDASELTSPINTDEVKAVITSLKKNKSPGVDGIQRILSSLQ
jgi:hypothetical protein